MSADARALFLLAMIMASSLGSIVPIIVRIVNTIEELAKSAEEKHVLERLLEATIEYFKNVAVILWDWLSSVNTTSVEDNDTGIDINITSIVGRELIELINKTISEQTIESPFGLGEKQIVVEPPYRDELDGNSTVVIEPYNKGSLVPAPR
ncbi:hypothetical protein J4526_07860 [Desulfurococcaceae archaeon MEX13E-LK6-19]|nr:hypothetical protein J4526_07860 [Desulfurococcaceae archaeon MEX13E-LK6-19]